jgi:hypothetical protein
MNIEDELKQLQSELEQKQKEIQAKKNAYQQYLWDWNDALAEHERRFPPPVTISVLNFNEQGLIVVSTDRNDNEVNSLLRRLGQYQYGTTHIKARYWKDFITELSKISYAILKIDDITKKRIEEYKPPVDLKFYIVKDPETHKFTKVGVTTRASGDAYYFTDKLRTGIFNHNTNTVYIDLVEFDFIPKLIADFKLDKTRTIEYDLTWEEYKNSLNVSEKKLEYDVPESFSLLRPFQKEGIKFVYEHQLRALVGDEMGLGKTVQGLLSFEIYADYIKKTENKDLTCLIICPASLKSNWLREIFKWTGKSGYLLSGSKPNKIDVEVMLKKTKRYYVINYDPIASSVKDKNKENEITDEVYPWVEVINIVGFDCIIADEIHYIKNIGSNRSKATLQLKAEHKIGLSGTLLVNRPRELWAPLKFIDKSLAGSYDKFLSFYENYNKAPRNLDHLNTILKRVMVRRVKKDVLKELPPINRITREYDLTETGNREYNNALQGLWRELDAWEGDSTPRAIAGTNLLER